MEEILKDLILENQNLIYALSNYFKGYSNKEDLFQAGCIGMLEAYKRFDSSYGAKFTTYAVPYILGEMRKLVRLDKNVKVSQGLNRLYLRIDKTYVLLAQQYMREPTFSEIAAYLEIPDYIVAEALGSRALTLSIDEPITSDGKELTLQEVIGSCDEIDELIDLKNALESLDSYEQNIIMMRYLQDKTQSQTAEALGTSQVQVYRKEQKILTKLKDKLVA